MAQKLIRAPALAQAGYEAGRALVREPLEPRLEHLVVAGIGGSAIGGDLLRDLSSRQSPIPILVVRDWRLPAFVGPGSGVVAVSYSGQTRETLSAFGEALSRGARLWALTSGGALAERASQEAVAVALLPGGLPPRAALGALFFSLVGLAEGLGLLGQQRGAVQEAVALWEELNGRFRPEAPNQNNSALGLARRLEGAVPAVYGVAGQTEAVARRWKSQFNENSKMPAQAEVLPELLHAEVVSYEAPSAPKRVAILLEDEEDGPEVVLSRQRLAEWLEQMGVEVERVRGEGQSRLARISSLVLLGDWVSYYAAVLRGVDPTPIRPIETFKEYLEDQTSPDE